jgi:hypothetical protein
LWHGQIITLHSDFPLTNQSLAVVLDENLERHGIMITTTIFNKIHADYLTLNLYNLNEKVYTVLPDSTIGVLLKI